MSHPPSPPPRRRSRVRAAVLGVAFALVAFELAIQVAAYVIWRTAGRETTGAGDGQLVVLCVGDSFTYGLGASGPTRSYPACLQRELDGARPGRFHVVNAGKPGQSTADVLRRLPGQLAEHRPWRVVVMAGYNDRWKKPDPVDPAALATRPAEDGFPLRFRTLELARRVLGALRSDAPGAPPPPSELYGSWESPELRVDFLRDGVCVVAGVEAPYRIDGARIEIGSGAAALSLTWERRGPALLLRGDAIAGGEAELERRDGPAGSQKVGRRILEDADAVAGIDEAAVARACAFLAENPSDSPLWWSTAAAAARGIGAERLLATVDIALGKIGRDDPWRAGLLRIRAGLIAADDPDGALAAILGAALVDGAIETVAPFLEGHGGLRREPFERAVARLRPEAGERARLDAIYARILAPESQLAEVLATHLALAAGLCGDAGAEASISTYPAREPVVDRAIREGAQRSGIAPIDVAAAFDAALAARPGDALFVMDGHCNDAGYALVAETIAAHLLELAPR